MSAAPHDNEVYCWLKQQLEPHYRVCADPQPGYFSEWTYRYRVLKGDQLLEELQGDLSDQPAGKLGSDAEAVVARLQKGLSDATPPARPDRGELPIASRLPPQSTATTWFSSGRAAFAWLLQNHVQPRRIWMPSLICWSLINTLQHRFADVEIAFYPIDRQLTPRYPKDVRDDDCLLFVHYFGFRQAVPDPPQTVPLLEDVSHLPIGFSPRSRGHVFGSLRKLYRLADGGFLRGHHYPRYEPASGADAWLRSLATDWRDMREAENMTDRNAPIADIASQSLAVLLQTDEQHMVRHRQQQEQILFQELQVGTPVRRYEDQECPLLHNRYLPDRRTRDDLRDFLAQQQIYCSIHWPVHPFLQERRDTIDCEDALWMQDHVLSFPVSQDFDDRVPEKIITACHDWHRAGGARFPQAS